MADGEIKDENQLAIADLAKAIPKWQASPKRYLKEVLGLTKIWRMQHELLAACPRAIKERKEIYVASGHALGKDYIAGAIADWFLYSFPPSIVLLTGPTDRQVKSIMWKEFTGHWKNHRIDLGGRIYADPHVEIAKDWFLLGFTTKETGATKEGGGGKFQGYHAPHVCVIVTEAQAVEDSIFDQIDAVTTSGTVLIIFIGNPTRAKGRFAQGLKDKKKNIVFNFSCLENPNYIERREVIPGLCSYDWVEKMRAKWGEDDPRWIGRVLGQVPDVSMNSVFPESLLQICFARHGFLKDHSDVRGVAVDPSGEGMDANMIMSASGGDIVDKFEQINMAPSELAMKSVVMCRAIKGTFIIVDCDGIGIGTYQELMKLPDTFLQGIYIIKFHGSGSSEKREGGKKIYANNRAEAAFIARDRAKRGHAGVNPKDKELIEELEADEYFENKRGEIQLVDKDEIKEKIDGRSPASADCWKMIMWASEQEFEKDIYRGESNPAQPAYCITEMTDRSRSENYGLTEDTASD